MRNLSTTQAVTTTTVRRRIGRRTKRVLIALAGATTALVLGCVGIFGAWLAGVHVPIASGATYLRVEKVAPLSAADRVGGGPGAPFFILLVGNDSRPGVGGARGDALHLLGVNPAKHQATMLDIPRDTCWAGDKINVGNTRGPRTQANDVGGLVGVQISYVVDVDFAGFLGLVDGIGGVDVERADADARHVLRRVLQPRRHHMDGTQALAFSRDRHDFPTSDIVRTHNQGLLILDAMRQLRAKMQNAPGEFKLLALLGPPRPARRRRHEGPVPARAGGLLAQPRPDPKHHDAVHGRAVPRPRRRRPGSVRRLPRRRDRREPPLTRGAYPGARARVARMTALSP